MNSLHLYSKNFSWEREIARELWDISHNFSGKGTYEKIADYDIFYVI